MTITQGHNVTRRPLRLWPAVIIATLQLLVMFLGPVVAPDAPLPVGMLGGIAGALAILIWWLLFSRAPWFERVGAIVLMVVGVLATKAVAHESMAGAGQGMLMYILPTPYLALALVAWAVVARHLQGGARRVALVVAILLACAPFALIRTAGVSSAVSQFHLRWTPTPEERLLALANDEPKPLPPAPPPAETPQERVAPSPSEKPLDSSSGPASARPDPAAQAKTQPGASAADELSVMPDARMPDAGSRIPAPEWPGFRGPNRDSIIRGVRINSDWSSSPPVELWRRPIGPGWSSFAVHGDVLYTQEQRGEDEVVSAYKVSTGEPVWRHRDRVRFYESNGGPGPRGTPTLHDGRVYTMGATGVLNALDALNGSVVWSRNAATDTGRAIPDWGISSSPLVIDDIVIVAVSGTLAAYETAAGTLRWVGPRHGGTYSSPQLVTIDGVPQVVLLSAPGAVSVSPADGKLLWEHTWEGGAIVQPAITADGGILINAMSMTGGMGTRRLAVTRTPEGWTATERWTSNGLKPYYNDFVVHNGHAFGFDGSILACIDLEDGKRKWKGGRYGNGQLVLLSDQNLLLVISEEGELGLVSATTDKFTEVARFPALEGKTWNHPVLVGNTLLVRNGEQMAAFRLSLAPALTSSAGAPAAPR
jgi:outer membrane protein assembly factor BamB